jgi:hypothetical protein
MQRDGAIEIGLGRTHRYRDRHRLDDLAGIVAEDVDAQHPVGLRVDHELHVDALLPARDRRLHRAETGFEDADVLNGGDRLLLGQANGADLRVVNTAEAMRLWSMFQGLPPNTLSAKAWPSRIATGVRLTRLVTSPTAWIDGTFEAES